MSRPFSASILSLLVGALALPMIARGQSDVEWFPPSSVAPHDVAIHALTTWDPDGPGGRPGVLVAGGRFRTAGGEPASNIAAWDGKRWTPLGAGVAGSARSAVHALAVFDDGSGPALYAGGEFTHAGGQPANNIAKWDGTAWSSLGEGTSAGVRALHVFHNPRGPALRVGGEFIFAGGIEVFFIADWEGDAWSDLENFSGSGTGTNGPVYALTSFEDLGAPALYVGGAFTSAGGIPANHVAKAVPNGAGTHSWLPLGAGVNGTVFSLTIFNDGTDAHLVLGGDFSAAGGSPANHIAKWDGNSTFGYTTGFDDPVLAVRSVNVGAGEALLAGGRFASAGDGPAARIAALVGPTWSPLGTGMPGPGAVHAVVVFDDGEGPAIFAGGSFKNAGGIDAAGIARWDGQSWTALGTGLR